MIGLESPSVVLIDEPSSGLDSHQALQVGREIDAPLFTCLGVPATLVLNFLRRYVLPLAQRG